MKEELANFYLQYLNDFLTVEKFAAYHSMSEQDAAELLTLGRKFHEEIADKPKPKGPPNRKEIWRF